MASKFKPVSILNRGKIFPFTSIFPVVLYIPLITLSNEVFPDPLLPYKQHGHQILAQIDIF